MRLAHIKSDVIKTYQNQILSRRGSNKIFIEIKLKVFFQLKIAKSKKTDNSIAHIYPEPSRRFHGFKSFFAQDESQRRRRRMGGAENTIRSLKFKKAEKKFSFYFSFAKAKMYRASF